MSAAPHPPIAPDRLRPRWRNLAEAGLGVPRAASDATFDALVAAYQGPGRAYHTLGHVAALLGRLAAWRWRLADWRGAELAAWFHDSVYGPDPAPGADERASAAAIQSFGDAQSASPALRRAVETATRLTLATIDHAPRADAPEDALFLDADLEILAADPGRYDAYAAAIRHEFAAVDDATFAVGRAAVIDRLLARERLYRRAADWEAPARANLIRERQRLGPHP